MDENYLDSLLNEVSLDKEIDHKIEEELDDQIQQEKRQHHEQKSITDEDLFNLDLESDVNELQMTQDVHFSEEQMDELDRLDNLADLDIGDLDFSDIDFDDLDVMKLDDVATDDMDDLLKEFEGDLDISNLFGSNEVQSEPLRDAMESIPEQLTDVEESIPEQTADLNEDSFNADDFLDSLLDDAELPQESTIEEAPDSIADLNIEKQQSTQEDSDEDLDLLQALEEFAGFKETTPAPNVEETVSQLSDAENDDLDDLLSMLELDDFSDTGSTTQTEAESIASDITSEDMDFDLDDIEELPSVKPDKKQKLMEILFGEPDEDDILSEEEIAELEAKKAAKKLKKEQAKKDKEEKAKAAKEEKSAKNNQKKKDEQNKKILKAQKKAMLKAQEMANAEPEKKLNKPAVLFIFSLFLGGVFLFYIGTNSFNYSQAIEKATKYFANQKYRKAYDEIVGVEVKEEDEDLKDRIYTVMYVERLYESYLNNVSLGRQEKALDSLLRGVDKYYEHYEEAQELGITSDLDYSFAQIQAVLQEQYGITIEKALEINKMENYDYVQYIQSVVGEYNDVVTGVNSEDLTLPEEQEEDVEE